MDMTAHNDAQQQHQGQEINKSRWPSRRVAACCLSVLLLLLVVLCPLMVGVNRGINSTNTTLSDGSPSTDRSYMESNVNHHRLTQRTEIPTLHRVTTRSVAARRDESDKIAAMKEHDQQIADYKSICRPLKQIVHGERCSNIAYIVEKCPEEPHWCGRKGQQCKAVKTEKVEKIVKYCNEYETLYIKMNVTKDIECNCTDV